MNNNLTDLNVIIDRSGSMYSRVHEANNSIAEFLAKQKELPGECKLNLVEFDEYYNVVYTGDLDDFGRYELKPRGLTALLDAVGKTINTTGNRLSSIEEKDRPGLVVFVIVTDGGENASQEFVASKIKEMVKHQEDKYNWQFTFLGAGLDVFAEAQSLGLQGAAFSNYGNAIASAGSNVARMRHATSNGDKVQSFYTSDELKSMNE